MIPDGPLLWYVNRSTGLVLILLLTTGILLGVWSTRGDAGTRVPRFAVQSLHRNVGLLSLLLLVIHVVSAVLDEFVDIRWWQAVVPADLHYEAGWLAAGIVASDLIVAVALTSIVRHRLSHRGWLLLHLTSYAAWVVALAHGLGIGTDTGSGWARWTYATSGVLVTGAVVWRLIARPERPTAPVTPAAVHHDRIGGLR